MAGVDERPATHEGDAAELDRPLELSLMQSSSKHLDGAGR